MYSGNDVWSLCVQRLTCPADRVAAENEVTVMERVKHLPFVAPIIEAFTNNSKSKEVHSYTCQGGE